MFIGGSIRSEKRWRKIRVILESRPWVNSTRSCFRSSAPSTPAQTTAQMKAKSGGFIVNDTTNADCVQCIYMYTNALPVRDTIDVFQAVSAISFGLRISLYINKRAGSVSWYSSDHCFSLRCLWSVECWKKWLLFLLLTVCTRYFSLTQDLIGYNCLARDIWTNGNLCLKFQSSFCMCSTDWSI